MNKIHLILPLCATFLISSSVSLFAYSKGDIGTTGADFLNLPVGARAIAMGGAYVGLADDATAIYWNPAGLVQIPKISATFMRAEYVDDISYQYAAYAHRISYDAVIGVSAFFTDIGSIERRDINGLYGGTFAPKDEVYTLAYSKAIEEFSTDEYDVSMGLSLKYISSKIDDSAKTWAGDFGVMTYNFGSIPYKLGVTAANIGSGLKYDVEESPLPLTFKFGGSAEISDNFVLAAEVDVPKGAEVNYMAGAELSLQPSQLMRFSAYAGINGQKLKDDLSGFSVGFGATIQFFSLEYAFVPMGDLGSTHRISLTFDFPFKRTPANRTERTVFADMNSLEYNK